MAFCLFFFHYYIFSLRFLIRVWQHFILFFEFNCSLRFDDECSFLQLIVGSRINLSSNCKCQLFNHHRAFFFYNFNLDEEFSNSIFISKWIGVVERPLPRRLPTRSPDGWPPIASWRASSTIPFRKSRGCGLRHFRFRPRLRHHWRSPILENFVPRFSKRAWPN